MLPHKNKNRIAQPINGFVMRFVVEATGFEPTPSASRRVSLMPSPLRMAFYSRFRSTANALWRSCVRCFRMLRACLWSDMWSAIFGLVRDWVDISRF